MHQGWQRRILRSALRVLPATIGVAVVTLTCYTFRVTFPTVSFLYLIIVVLQSLGGDLYSSVVVSVISFLCLNYFFVPPILSLRVSDLSDTVALVSFLTTGLLVTWLTSRAREAAQAEKLQREEITRLYELTQHSLALDPEAANEAGLLKRCKLQFGLRAVSLFDAATLDLSIQGESLDHLGEKTRSAYISQKAFHDTASSTAIRLLQTGDRVIGAIGFEGLSNFEMTAGPLAALATIMMERSRWKQLKKPGERVLALNYAIQCYQAAYDLKNSQEYLDEIARLRLRVDVGRRYGEKALDQVNLVTPIAVEVASDLISYLEGELPGSLTKELESQVRAMRARVLEELGVKVPGIQFRGNETDLPNGTYVILVNEIPLVSSNLRSGDRFCPGSEKAVAQLGIKGNAAVNPISGQEGFWIESEDLDKVGAQKLELWEPTEYLMRHVEAVFRKNIVEFLGYQEIYNLLESQCAGEAIREASAKVTAFTRICRALVAEEVPIHPFPQVCSTFNDLYNTKTGSFSPRDVVEHIRRLPAMREHLPGNDGQHTLLQLSPKFEEQIRTSLYQCGSHWILAMKPETCQEALSAIRDHVNGRSLALVVNDSPLRPFVRKLVELEFPNLHVLSQDELVTEIRAEEIQFISTDSDSVLTETDFRSPLRVDALNADSGNSRAKSRASLSQIGIDILVSEDFMAQVSAADDKPMAEMFALMQDGLFYELGILLPEVQLRTDTNITPPEFRICLNGKVERTIKGLANDEFLVNDTVDRLRLLAIQGRSAVNPSNGNECAIVSEAAKQADICTQAGLTVCGPGGYLVLCLSAAIRRAAALFQTDEATRYQLDALGQFFPDLVRTALQRYTLPQLAGILRELLAEEISIRDLLSILESLLSVDGTTDVDLSRFIVSFANSDGLCPARAARGTCELTVPQLADYVRASLKRYISHKYTRGTNTLIAYLVDAALEQRIAEDGTRPLTELEQKDLLAAITEMLAAESHTSEYAVLLTTYEVRRALRRLIEDRFSSLAVVSYQELSPDMNIQPIGRISTSAARYDSPRRTGASAVR